VTTTPEREVEWLLFTLPNIALRVATVHRPGGYA
jgi:hypothetical protein